MSATQTVTADQIHAAQGGDSDAMWYVLSAYEPQLRSIIRTVTGSSANQEDVEDLLQDARVALMETVRDYDTESAAGADLSSYAHRAVRRVVADGWLSSRTSLSVEPSAGHRVKYALWAHGGDVEAAWTSVSTDPDARRRLSRETFVSVCEALMETVALDAPQDGTDGATLGENIPDTSMDVTAPVTARDTARYLLGKIMPRQSYALRAFYGINMTKMPDDQVRDELGLSGRGSAAALRQLRQRGIYSARSVARRQGLAA